MSKVNRTLARLRLRRMQMRREGKLLLNGYTPPHYGWEEVNVANTWRRAGWMPTEWWWDQTAGGWRPRRATMTTHSPVYTTEERV